MLGDSWRINCFQLPPLLAHIRRVLLEHINCSITVKLASVHTLALSIKFSGSIIHTQKKTHVYLLTIFALDYICK